MNFVIETMRNHNISNDQVQSDKNTNPPQIYEEDLIIVVLSENLVHVEGTVRSTIKQG